MSHPRILVTGGTGTLGSELVRVLSQNFLVTANFSQDDARARQLRAETGCDLFRADVGDEEQMNGLFEAVAPLFAVVHVAGIACDALLLRQQRIDWDATLRINLEAAFLVARRSLTDLQDGGRLIFFASRVGEVGERGQTAYAASKAGVVALMQTAAREGAVRRLAVNAICPGYVPSRMNEGLDLAALPHARRASVFDELGSARETASLVQWLLAPEAAAVSGQVFHCHSRI